MTDGIARLLRPRSIAVIGGGAWCANVVEQCRKIGFGGDIWPVHPTRDHVGGIAAFRRIEDLPEAPDASFIGINRDATIEAVEVLAARGAGGAVCFASGFREAQAEVSDGASRQDDLLAAAGDMTILGPNCYGFLNYLDGAALWPDQHGGVPLDAGVALISQSSNIAINLTMQTRGLPIAYTVTVGNQGQTSLAAIGQALLDDPRVTALGLYIEGISDLRGFEALAAAARRLGKSIVALKVGQSEQAQTATISHTASLAGSDAGAAALLARLGIARVHSIEALLETLKILHVGGPLTSNRVATMSSSGGEASLMADTALRSGLEFPALSPPQETALRTALGPRVALANPLDYHTYIWNDVDAMAQAFGAMMLGDLAIGCVILDFPRPDRCDRSDWERVIASIDRAQASSGRRMAVLASLPEAMPEDIAERLIGIGITPLIGFADAVEALDCAAWLGREHPDPAPLLLPTGAEGGVTLDEAASKSALAAHGLRIPVSGRADTPEAAAEAATRIGGAVVLKGEGIAHKTEAGAVVTGLCTPDEVRAAAARMQAESFLVEEMITGAEAEFLVGAVADPAHGFVLTVAAGGTLTEVLDDRASLMIPAARDAVRQAVLGLRIGRVVHGYRGRPGIDLEALLDAVDALQSYVISERPVEVELNPILCGPHGAVAVDALVRTGGET